MMNAAVGVHGEARFALEAVGAPLEARF